jgi:hypothetical protein
VLSSSLRKSKVGVMYEVGSRNVILCERVEELEVENNQKECILTSKLLRRFSGESYNSYALTSVTSSLRNSPIVDVLEGSIMQKMETINHNP